MPHPYDRLTTLATPAEGMGLKTPEAYEQAHRVQMTTLQQKFPELGFQMPWLAPDGAIAWAAGGKWIVTCSCGDCPMASPRWNEARCFSCGAIYRGIVWPTDRAAIESALARRPAAFRAWLPGETADDLRVENAAHKGAW
jgi:hypothetical protein